MDLRKIPIAKQVVAVSMGVLMKKIHLTSILPTYWHVKGGRCERTCDLARASTPGASYQKFIPYSTTGAACVLGLIILLAISLVQNSAAQSGAPSGKVTAGDTNVFSVEGFSPYMIKDESTGIANTSFDSQGGWNLDEGFKIEAGVGRTGNGALFYSRSDPSKYRFASLRLNLKPSLKYKVGVWIRTEEVTGGFPNETGATFAIEFADSNDPNGYRGGDYATGVRGTQGWTHITMITALREANVTPTLRLYMRPGMTGRAWFDGVTIEPVGIADWTVYQILPQMQRLPLDGRSVLLGSDGGIPQEVSDPSCLIEAEQDGKSKGSALVPVASSRISFKPSDLGAIEPGPVNLKLTLLSPSTKAILAKNYLEVTAVAGKSATDSSACTIDDHGRTLVGGKPFMPIGFYKMGITPADLARLKDSPFNTVMPYNSPFLSFTNEYGLESVRRVLDDCHSSGIKVVYSLKDLHENYWGYPCGLISPKQSQILGEDPSKGADHLVRHAVNSLKDNPAILAWYTGDEMELKYAPQLDARRRLINTLDSSHPVWAVFTHVTDLARFGSAVDVMGIDRYPIFNDNSNDMPNMKFYLDQLWKVWNAPGTGASWAVIQAHDTGIYDAGLKKSMNLRAPTEEEIRCLTIMHAIAGMRGFFFYSYFDLQRQVDGKTFDERWAMMVRIGAMVKSLEPLIMSTTPIQQLVIPATQGSVSGAILRGENGEAAVLLSGYNSPQAKIKIPGLPKLRSKYGFTKQVSDDEYLFTGKGICSDILTISE